MESTSSTTATTTTAATRARLNIGGVSSGIQWNDIIDSTIDALSERTVKPITDRITLRTKQKDAWMALQKLVDTVNVNATAVRRAGFGGYTTTVPTSPVSGRSLLTASASATATPGRYRVEVLQLADTAKLAGATVADTSVARGVTGTMQINGVAVAVDAADSLATIRTKINDANTGVTASLVSEGGTAGRLVLTSNTAGATGMTVTDGAGGLARELGLVDSRSKQVSSATQAAAAALGLSVSPSPASIRVGGTVITVDLATTSLSSIAARINAAGGSASVQPEAFGDQTRYRLVMDGNVTAVDGDAGSQAVIDALGITAGLAGSIPQTVQSAAYTDAADAVAGVGTSLAGLKVDGASANLAVGDAINIRGTRGDGTAVTIGLVVGVGDTMQTLLDRINDATSGFGSGTRTATAALGADGRIRLTDDTAGASRVSLSLNIARANSTTGTLGAATTSVLGRPRELQAGQDAVIRVDGREVRRTTNKITDGIPGVTLSLTAAEPDAPIDIEIERDVKGATDSVQKLVESYNAIRAFFDEQRAVDAPLYADSGLRRVVESMTTALRTEVTGNATYARAATAGVTLDRNGLLTFNQETFKTAFNAKPTEIESLFGFSGVGGAFVTAADQANSFSSGPINLQLRTIAENNIVLRSREVEAQRRLDLRREQLVAQFTRMENALARLNSQSSSLTASVQGLQANRS
jgi:flagellar hook-associated protein 2